jgi:hypothetical protein
MKQVDLHSNALPPFPLWEGQNALPATQKGPAKRTPALDSAQNSWSVKQAVSVLLRARPS